VDLSGVTAVVTGGASGLGLATARYLQSRGASVVIADLSSSPGSEVAGQLARRVRFVAADVTSEEQMQNVFDVAVEIGPLRALVHCAGGSLGNRIRLVERDGAPGSLERFTHVVNVNLIGTFNALRLAAARMARNDLCGEERGVCVLTSSVAAFEGQIGQIPYSAAKAAVAGMTLVAARDLASKAIRVCAIAPGTFDTPPLAGLRDEIRASLAAAVPHPSRLGAPDEFAALAAHIIENPMLNGETIRLDGAIRMPPR
jgi:NAD(P)-dependent dehydrogenase (short-subunit alcohol dehydrogenase family)